MPSILPGDTVKIFVDMDGVLTDFDQAVRSIGVEPLPPTSEDEVGKKKMYSAIDDAGVPFWSNMQWKAGGQELWSIISRICPNPTLLSSPGFFRYAPRGKKLWVQSNLPGIPLFLSTAKSQYADREIFLVDDDTSNIGAWKEAGGIGILYTGSPQQVEQEILKYLWR